MLKKLYILVELFGLCCWLSVGCLASDAIIFKRKVLKRERPGYAAEINYPQIVSGAVNNHSALNQAIRDQALTKLRQFTQPLHDPQNKWRLESGSKNSLYVNYEVILNADGLVSIRFISTEYYSGAAHPVKETFALNFDLINNKQLRLRDIFKPGSNYKQIISQWCDQYFRGRALGKVERFNSWNLKKEGLIVNFDHCSILPCSEGVQSILIRFAKIKRLIRADSPVSKYAL